MSVERVEYKFIETDSEYYAETVSLRFQVFYEASGLDLRAVQDDLENRSLHLVAIVNAKVVGYIRLTLDGETARLTQFVLSPDMRGKSGIAQKLMRMIMERAKTAGAKRVCADIRLPVSEAAKAYGFRVSEEVIPSSKTGIPHRRIEKAL
jgi:ribosomal protein S18 acetylase RimI-like enzyme